MKLIQAMKKLKSLVIKADDLRGKVAQKCSDLSIETPEYGDRQKEQVSLWIQSHSDVLKEVLELRIAVQRTNLATMVTIELGGHQINKCIAAWIHRRRDLSQLDMQMWAKLGDKGLKEVNMPSASGGPPTEIRIRRYFDPKERDTKIELYRTEASIIDGVLETVNATTDLIEA